MTLIAAHKSVSGPDGVCPWTVHADAFHRCFEAENNSQLFEGEGASLVRAVLSGYNGTLVAYGQTGSGKTHTIAGVEGDEGQMPRMLHALFDGIASAPPTFAYDVSLQYLQVHNERESQPASQPTHPLHSHTISHAHLGEFPSRTTRVRSAHLLSRGPPSRGWRIPPPPPPPPCARACSRVRQRADIFDLLPHDGTSADTPLHEDRARAPG